VSYTVFARKYRPQTFDDVVGQDHITQTLKNAILQNRLAHAYLFVGPRGTGKTSSARILAKALNCLKSDSPTVDPCGECHSCKEITAGNSLDVLEFDAASNTQVEKVRDIIIDNVKFMPARGRFKVYLVDEVHMLSTGSFNALLKTLEEPPRHVKFLFATTDVQKLPATILSRCQRFDLKRIGAPVIAGHLLKIAANEGIELSADAALAIAVGADGGMRDAESMLDQLVAFCGGAIGEEQVLSVFGFSSRQKISDLCTALLAQDAPQALTLIHEQAEAGRDLTQLLSDVISHLRNLLLAQADPGGLVAELGADLVEALRIQCANIDRERLLELIDIFASAEQRMKWAANKQMHLEVAMLRAIHAVSQVTLSEVIDTLSAIREGRESAPRKTQAPAPIVMPKSKPPTIESGTQLARSSQAALKPATKPAEQPVAPLKETAAAKREEPPKAEQPAQAKQPITQAAEVKAADPVEKVPQAEMPEIPETPEASRVAEPSAAAAEKEVSVVWPELVKLVRQRRPLISMWLESGALLSAVSGKAVIGFSKDQNLAFDYIQQANNKTFLEEVLTEIVGATVSLSCEKHEAVELVPVPKASPPAAGQARDPMEEFKDDPLIRKALELFKARIEAN
jgi:DNA polymerase-3 subunit gamma/tau